MTHVRESNCCFNGVNGTIRCYGFTEEFSCDASRHKNSAGFIVNDRVKA